MKSCPKCGSLEFYVVTRMSGVGQYHYHFDGTDAYNGELHECLTYRDGKTAYCAKCHKRLGRAEDLIAASLAAKTTGADS